jgi:hypothetical protein
MNFFFGVENEQKRIKEEEAEMKQLMMKMFGEINKKRVCYA